MPAFGIISDEKRASLPPMTALLLLVFAFGANGLNSDPIWTDELYAISHMGGFDGAYNPGNILRSLSENAPDQAPLFFLLGGAWAGVAGWSQFALRLLPVLCGALMIAMMYRLGADIFNRATGLLAALLLGCSAYMILYIHDFRMYTLLLMLSALHLWGYWRLAHGRAKGMRSYAFFVATAAALLYTHIFSFIYFAALGSYHLTFVRKSHLWRRVILAWCAAGALFLPYIPGVWRGLQAAADKSEVASRAAPAPELMSAWLLLIGNGSWLIVAAFAVIFVLAVYRSRQRALLRFMFIPLAMIAAILALNAVVGIIPITRMRYFLVTWIPLLLVLARCLSLLPRRRLLTLLFILVYCAAGYRYYRSVDILGHAGSMVYTQLYPPLQNYVYHLSGKARAHDYLLGFTYSDHINSDLKLGQSVADYYTQLQLGIDGAFIRGNDSGERLEQRLPQRMDDQPYLLLATNPRDLAANHDIVMAAITSDYVACQTLVQQPDLLIRRYVDAMIACDRDYRGIAYDNGVAIADRFARYLPGQGVVRIVTGWEVADESALGVYNISLQIIDADWQNLAQDDRHLDADLLKWHRVELPTDQLRPGDYRVMVIVYERETLQKVSGTDLVSGAADSMFPVLTFTVEG